MARKIETNFSKTIAFFWEKGYNNKDIKSTAEEWKQIPLFWYVIRRFKLANIEEKVEELVTKSINDLGYIVYDVRYTKEGKDNYLRIFIDSENGISLDDC